MTDPVRTYFVAVLIGTVPATLVALFLVARGYDVTVVLRRRGRRRARDEDED